MHQLAPPIPLHGAALPKGRAGAGGDQGCGGDPKTGGGGEVGTGGVRARRVGVGTHGPARRASTDCQPAAISLCHGSGLLATAPVRPPLAAAAAAAAGSTPPGGAQRAAATQQRLEDQGPLGPGACPRATRGGARGAGVGGAARERRAPKQDAGCGGPDTSWKLLEMAPATAPEGAASPGRAIAPAGLLSRARTEPEQPSPRSAVGSG